MMTTIQMVEQKGQCNGDEIHAKIARIRHRISELSQVYSLRMTFRLSRARPGNRLPSHFKGHPSGSCHPSSPGQSRNNCQDHTILVKKTIRILKTWNALKEENEASVETR